MGIVAVSKRIGELGGLSPSNSPILQHITAIPYDSAVETEKPRILQAIYSYRSASTGSRLAARLAG